MGEPDVVVTGMGLICALGSGIDEAWEAAIEGECNARRIQQYDVDSYDLSSEIAYEVTDFDSDEYDAVDGTEERITQFALATAEEACEQAELDEIDPEDVGVSVGVAMTGMQPIEVEGRKDPSEISESFVEKYPMASPVSAVADYVGAGGAVHVPTTACATGTHAVGEAVREIRRGRVDAMIAGSTCASITPSTIGGFAALRALTTTHNQSPKEACRPFDADRDGFVQGEGSGIFVLETREHAEERGANIIAEITGRGATGDAHHITRGHPESKGFARCIEQSLEDAGRAPEDVDYISAHATSTPEGDSHEANAIERVFGESAPPVHGPKSLTGHGLGAAGTIELALAFKSVVEDRVPPTLNHDVIGEEINIPVIGGDGLETDVDVVMLNSAGFGSTNGTLVIEDSE